MKLLRRKLENTGRVANEVEKRKTRFLLIVRPMWGYRCEDNRCQKFKLTSVNNSTADGLSICRLFCHESNAGTLWPIPSGRIALANETVKIDPIRIGFRTLNFNKEPEFWTMAADRFYLMQQKKIPQKYSLSSGGIALVVEVVVATDDMSKFMQK